MMAGPPFHPLAELFPLLEGGDYRALADDIAANGLREPIVLCDGAILDGRNRYAACLTVGVEPEFTTYDGDDPLAFVLSLNLHRRHLTASQRAACALAALPEAEERARERQVATRFSGDGGGNRITAVAEESRKARDEVAAAFNVSPAYVQRAKAIAEAAPDLVDPIRSGDMTLPEARREVRRREFETRREALRSLGVGAAANAQLELHQADIADAATVVPPGSVDYIITDPPYPREFLHVYGELAAFASHALRPGGSLLVMVGKSYLPEIIAALDHHLTYHWVVSYLTPGGQAVQLWDRKVNTFWKPVLWYVSGDYSGEWIGDVARSDPNNNDKRFHHWGQSESGMYDLARRFVRPGNVVCDPFCGGGTTGVAALALGARFIGLDTDGDALDVARGRLTEVAA